MNVKHLFAMSLVAVGLTWSGGHAMASDSAKGMAPSGDINSGSANSGVFSGVPDPNSPGGTKDAGKGSAGNPEMGNVRQGGELDSERSNPSRAEKPSGIASSSDSSSGGDSSGSSSTRRDSGTASEDKKVNQVGQRQDEQVGDTRVRTGMQEGESQHATVIKGEVLRIEGDNYFVKGPDGKEVRVHIDQTTKMGDQKLGQGDRIEATVNEQNHVLSLPSPDRRNDHTLESGQAVEPR